MRFPKGKIIHFWSKIRRKVMVSSSNFGSEGMKYQPRHIHRKAVDHA
jgi:hypothetical protein